MFKMSSTLDSHYKGCETIKLLMGIAPSGLLTFLSNAYGGRANDKAIFNQSDIMQKMDPKIDAIMVDKGFSIENECLEKKEQLSKEDVAHTNEIAAARVHVERTIQRFKTYDIVKSKLSWVLIPYIDDICTIVGGLVNLQNPIMADNKY